MSVARDMSGAHAPRRKGRVKRNRIQSVLVVVLLALVILAPLPLGSNRPVFWALGALVMGMTGAIYFGLLSLRGAAMRTRPRWMGIAAAAGAVWLGWCILQALPLGTLIDGIPAASILLAFLWSLDG